MHVAVWLLTVVVAADGEMAWEAVALEGPGVKAPIQLRCGEILAAGTTRLRPAGRAVACYVSDDRGKTWRPRGEIVRDETPTVDLGDGAFLERRNGELLFVYRHNFDYYFDPALADRDHVYRIEVAVSHDQGRTWQHHSTVKSIAGTRMGLWSPSLFERSDGTLQCYHDDEHVPEQQGLRQHQWTMMWTWDDERRQWVDPVVVSRAHDPAHLSRDGMCSVVELPDGRLLAALESVQTDPPHRGCTRTVTSDDGGKTWSWQDEERRMLYAPEDPTYNALSPWLVRLSNGNLFAVFTTDEDRAEPGVCAIQRLDQDVKYVLSTDNGHTWRVPRRTIVSTAEEGSLPWRYTFKNPGTGWELSDFQADEWPTGSGGFGTAGTPGMIIGTPWLTSDIWLRCTFELPADGMLHPRLRVYHNEDVDVYINGALALHASGYTNGYAYHALSPAAVAALRAGQNTLAVRCRQTAGAQYIDVGLYDMRNIIDNQHPLLFPGACELKSDTDEAAVLVQYARRPAHRTKRGTVLGQ